MPPETGSALIATTVMGHLMPRLKRTHLRGRIAVFSGPPGIGKTTVVEAFRAANECAVAVVAVPPGTKTGVKPGTAVQLAIDALRGLDGHGHNSRRSNSYVELRHAMFSEICAWAGLDEYGPGRQSGASPLSIIFDEAQNLSREAIEVLRFANDAGGGYSPFPLGLVFIGNNEFVLKSDRRGPSVLSAAVADRALYTEILSYSDVTNSDLMLFFEERGLIDPSALQLVMRHFGTGRVDRSFRRAADLWDELNDEAGGRLITPEVVRDLLFNLA